MCLSQVLKDIKTALTNPPRGALDREILHSRLRAYWVRIQYIAWNILAISLLYGFTDSLLNVYIINKQYYYNIIFHSIQCISIIAYFITSFRNPGYIASKNHIDIECIMRDIENENDIHIDIDNEMDYKYLDFNINFNFNADNKLSNETEEYYPYQVVESVPDYNHMIRIDPDAAPTNFCWRCKFIRPIRSKHCYDCDRCVAKFDHHCPMVGNCVAGRNHRFFVLFMSAQTTVVLWTFYISLNTLFEMNSILNTNNNNNKKNMVPRTGFGWFLRIIFFVAIFFAVFVTVGLCGYHIYLGFTNQTTYEMIKPQIVESYIKDEIKRKKKYLRKKEKRQSIKILKKEKEKEIKREKELKRQQIELQKQINNLQENDEDDDDNKDDEKYYNKVDDESDESMIMSSDDDISSISEKGLLFDAKQRGIAKLKRSGTPSPNNKNKKGKNKKHRKHEKKVNYTDEYRNYFDEGCLANLVIFFTGKMYPEWITPLPCYVITKPSTNNNNNNN